MRGSRYRLPEKSNYRFKRYVRWIGNMTNFGGSRIVLGRPRGVFLRYLGRPWEVLERPREVLGRAWGGLGVLRVVLERS